MAGPAEPVPELRRLGRSRTYGQADIPKRFFEWHTPRPGRWVRLCVTSGVLQIEWRDGTFIRPERLDDVTARWVASGTRWRVVDFGPETRFELEVYAKATNGNFGISPARAALLAESRQVSLGEASGLEAFTAGLELGEQCIVHGHFHWSEACREIKECNRATLSWHPMMAGADGFTAFVTRMERPMGLADYLCRDHAVIESALSGLLQGREDHALWLRGLLDRHIRIEEDLLFPRYLEAGGRSAWVRSLEKEHARLRQSLESLADERVRQALPRALDSHDEKEERIIYPDVVRFLGSHGKDLAQAVFLFPCVP